MTQKRTRARTFALFQKRFRPVPRTDGTILWQLDEVRLRMRHSYRRYWWTLLDCDGKLCLSPGFRYINRLNYVCCEAPWTDADQPIDYRYG